MELNLTEVLSEHPVILLFLIIGLGYLVGKLKIFGFELGPAGGVLFAALYFGHRGYELPMIIETIGFAFFIYSVGYQSGSRFFSTFKIDGMRYILLSLVVAVTAFGTVVMLASFFDFDKGFAAGILGGALTSTPTLAAAQDAVNSGLVSMETGVSVEQVISNITVGYAITYVFGLIGLLLFMRLFPILLKINLPEEADKLTKCMNIDNTCESEVIGLAKKDMAIARIYQVTNPELVQKSLADLSFIHTTGCILVKIKRHEELIKPTVDLKLQLNDVVAVIGNFDNQKKALKLLGGPEVYDDELMNYNVETKHVILTNNDMAGLTLPQSGIASKYSCFIEKLLRFGMEIPLTSDVKLEKGDHLILTGISEQLEDICNKIGHAELPIHETDLRTFAFGIAGGIILGTFSLRIESFSVTLGMAGGLLMMGLLVGLLRSQNPTFGRVPTAARFILMELGILFFLSGIGLRAGHGLLEGLQIVGFQVFISGVVVTIVPVMTGFLFGRFFLKMNPVLLLGTLAGCITSTPALSIVNKAARSTLPSVGYVGSYAFANIILTLAGQIIMYL